MSYLAVIAGLLMMRAPAAPRAGPGLELREASRRASASSSSRGPIAALLLLLGVVSLAGMPYSVLMPIFADRILHGGARALGLLMAFSGLRRARGGPDARDAEGGSRARAVGRVLAPAASARA